jgi:hypothetical protein
MNNKSASVWNRWGVAQQSTCFPLSEAYNEIG